MISATFIFNAKQFDDDFHALDATIADVAKQTTGYIGEVAWENPSTGQICNVYYWKSMEGLQALMQHPKHLEAKAKQANWLAGYQVYIAEVLRAYGDGSIDHPTQQFVKASTASVKG